MIEEGEEEGAIGTTEALAPGTEPTEEPTGIKTKTTPTRESGLILLKRTAITPLQLAKSLPQIKQSKSYNAALRRAHWICKTLCYTMAKLF